MEQQAKQIPPTSFWLEDSVAGAIITYDAKKNTLTCYSNSDLVGDRDLYLNEDSTLTNWGVESSVPWVYFLDDEWKVIQDSLSSNLSKRTGCGTNLLVHYYKYNSLGQCVEIVDDENNIHCYTYDAQNRLYQLSFNGRMYTYVYENNRLQRVVDNRRENKVFIEVFY